MLEQTPLGQKSAYVQTYTPTLLFPIPRGQKPFMFGYDLWHGYELSWLNSQGKPMVCVAEFIFPCTSPFLIESKSFKLYLNSFNQTVVLSIDALTEILQKDLSLASGAKVSVKLKTLENGSLELQKISGICLDEQNITCDTYEVNPDFLSCEENLITQTLYSHLLKSDCPVTDQPDWGALVIKYTGKQINPEGLLRYIVSFRNHQDFHEACVERIFNDIKQRMQPEQLTVAAHYTRRGGLDINPVRSSHEIPMESIRLWRQ